MENKPSPKRLIHLSTAVILMLVFGVDLGLNLKHSLNFKDGYGFPFCIVRVGSDEVLYWRIGWGGWESPLTMYVCTYVLMNIAFPLFMAYLFSFVWEYCRKKVNTDKPR